MTERRKLKCFCSWISVHYNVILAKKLRLKTYVCQRSYDQTAGWIPLVRFLAGADVYFSTSHPGVHKAPGERRLRKVAFGAEVKDCMELCMYSPMLFQALHSAFGKSLCTKSVCLLPSRKTYSTRKTRSSVERTIVSKN